MWKIIMEELLMFDNVKEECGVFGVYSKKPEKLLIWIVICLIFISSMLNGL